MGGYGSGRRADVSRETLEDLVCIDADALQRSCSFEVGSFAQLNFALHRRPWRQFEFRVDEGSAIIQTRQEGDVPRHCRIEIEPYSCRFGGFRYYFRCPFVDGNVGCHRRVTKIYWYGNQFRCRQCTALSYRSQSESQFSRNLRRGNRIRIRLGGSRSALDPIPIRPKGMWRRTYFRLFDECRQAEDSAMVIAGSLLPSGPKIAECRSRRRKLR